ncbi:tandem-95 repeat protein [bacterium]|nr:tandem-95 repeat protein [bacterium]MBU1063469.1 tandem-95 repeat protein [bacterium]MBU1634479.1 tandem-95 repeat protein [bacterium]MBU1874643.1 tandem-95 repeat protein [bacterium]
MVKNTIKTFISLALFSMVILFAAAPDWSVNPANYDMSANMIAVLKLNNVLDENPNNRIAAFVDDVCRAVASPTNVMNSWMYFAYIYSNTVNETIGFKVYLAGQDTVLDIVGTIIFKPDALYGSVGSPYQLRAYLNYDFPPVVGGIPDQSIEAGESFRPIDLENYLELSDADPVFWSFSGNQSLSVSIDGDNIATITLPSADWTGTDRIIFTVTDQKENGQSDSDTISCTVRAVDHPPQLGSIPDQTIGMMGSFNSIALNAFLTEQDGDEIEWSYRFVNTTGSNPAPNWSVNAANYELSMSLTAAVSARGEPMLSGSHLLGAFAVDPEQPESAWECRGIAGPTSAMGTWLYFMTIYADINREEIRFRYFDGKTTDILAVMEELTFTADISYGEPTNPYILSAGYIGITITADDIAWIDIIDSTWSGNELVKFYARDLNTMRGYADSTDVLFTVLPDYQPHVKGIPNQTVEIGSPFSTFNLDDYLTLYDSDAITWSYSGNSVLNVSIGTGNVVTISISNSSWTGSETITFTATDNTTNGLYDSDEAVFTIRPEDHPPQVLDIPAQITGSGGSFPQIYLDNYLTELDGDPLAWSYRFSPPVSPDNNPNWTVDASDFELSMTLTGVVFSRDKTATGNQHVMAAFAGEECRGTTKAVQMGSNWLYFLTIYANTNGDTISFRFYDALTQMNLPVQQNFIFNTDAAIGNPQQPTDLYAGLLKADINDLNQARIQIIDSDWTGTEKIWFIAEDVGTVHNYTDSTEVSFTILPDHLPLVEGIPDQTVEQGTAFTSFDLDDYLIKEDDDLIIWSYSNNVNFNVNINTSNIATVSAANSEWTGREIIIFTATDDTPNRFSDSDSVLFTILPFDHAPEITEIPDQIIGINGTFSSIDLNQHLIEQDGDSVSWSYRFPGPAVPENPPAWAVNPADYEQSMSLVAQVYSNGDLTGGGNYYLAAFAGDTCRGVSTPTPAVGSYLYFLTIYANTNGEAIRLQFYDKEIQEILPVDQQYAFSADAIYGMASEPVELNAGYLKIRMIADVARISVVDDTWFGTEEVHFIVRDIETLHEYADTQLVTFTVLNDHQPELSGIPDQTIDEGGQFTSFNLNDYLNELDGDSVLWSATGNEDLLLNVSNQGLVEVLIPDEDWNGSETIVFIATDYSEFGLAGRDTVIFTVQPVNDPPMISALSDTTINEDDTLYVQIEAMDPDGDDIEFQLLSSTENVGLSLNNMILSAIPSKNWFGEADLTIIVSDDEYSDSSSFHLTVNPVNDAPVISALSDASTNEDESLMLSVSLVDVENDLLVINAYADTSEITVTATDSTLTLTPHADWNGSSIITFSVHDNQDTSEVSFILIVIPVNDRPVVYAGQNMTVLQGMTVKLNGSQSYDVDGDQLIYYWNAPEILEIADTNAVQTSFKVPKIDIDTVYIIELNVSDAEFTSIDSVKISVPAMTVDNLLPDFPADSIQTGQSLALTISFPDYFVVDSVNLNYTTGTGFVSIPMTLSPTLKKALKAGFSKSSGTISYTAEVPSESVGFRGIAYNIYAVDENGNSLQTETVNISVNFPANTITTHLDQSAYESGLPKNVWRLISLPGVINNPSVSAVLSATLNGKPDNRKWQIYEWDGSDWITPDTLETGNGYWIQQRVTDNVHFTTGKGRSVDLNGVATELMPGWNLISSPYPFLVSADLDEETFAGPYQYGNYDGEGWSDTLVTGYRPWEAYAVFNRTDTTQALQIDPLIVSQPALQKETGDDGWEMKISAKSGQYSDKGNRIGRHDRALDKMDKFDQPEPPNVDGYVSVYCQQTEDFGCFRQLSADFRALEKTGQIWDLEIVSQKCSGTVQLTFTGTGDLSDEQIRLVDIQTRDILNLPINAVTHHQISRADEQSLYLLKLLSGSESQIEEMIKEVLTAYPEDYSLMQNYPNPFNATTTIRFSIIKPGDVSIVVYDLRGYKVKTLIQKSMNLGYHEVRWDGLNEAGKQLGSGVYLYAIQAGDFHRVRKMILMK